MLTSGDEKLDDNRFVEHREWVLTFKYPDIFIL